MNWLKVRQVIPCSVRARFRVRSASVRVRPPAGARCSRLSSHGLAGQFQPLLLEFERLPSEVQGLVLHVSRSGGAGRFGSFTLGGPWEGALTGRRNLRPVASSTATQRLSRDDTQTSFAHSEGLAGGVRFMRAHPGSNAARIRVVYAKARTADSPSCCDNPTNQGPGGG